MTDTIDESQIEELLEPVLPMSEIQGIVVPGFLKQHQTLLGVTATPDSEAVVAFKQFLRKFS